VRRPQPALMNGISSVTSLPQSLRGFDEPNLVSAAGLVPTLALARTAGLEDLLEESLSVASANVAAKSGCGGGDARRRGSIDGLGLLRAGGTAKLFEGGPGTLDAGELSALVHPWARPAARRGEPAAAGAGWPPASRDFWPAPAPVMGPAVG
jgi:hypothetical protein